MPYAMRMEGPILRLEFTGTFTNADLSRGAVEMADFEEATKVIPHRIADLRPVARVEIDFVGVFALAEARRRRRYQNSFKTAIIATDVVRYGFARMFQTLNDHPQIVIAIFGDEPSAREWLALPDFEAPRKSWQPRAE